MKENGRRGGAKGGGRRGEKTFGASLLPANIFVREGEGMENTENREKGKKTYRLNFEMVPEECWYANLRSVLPGRCGTESVGTPMPARAAGA